MPRALRQEHRRLPGRVSAADDDDLVADAQLRLDVRGGVVDAQALELAEVVELQLAILHARRDDDGAGAHIPVTAELHRKGTAGAVEALGMARDSEVGAELDRLAAGARRQRLARDAHG